MTPQTSAEPNVRESPPTPADADSDGIQSVILRKHGSLLSQLFVLQYGSRALCLLAAVFLVVTPSVTGAGVGGVVCVFFLLTAIWTLVESRLSERIEAIETALAKRAGGKWEDTFIKSKHVPKQDFYFYSPFLDTMATVFVAVFCREKVLWAMMLGAVIALRIIALHGPVLSTSL